MPRLPLTLLAFACAPALAQSGEPAQPAAPAAPAPPAATAPAPTTVASDLLPWHRDDKWTVRFEPAVYYVALSGDATLPRSPGSTGPNTSIQLSDINLDEPRLSPFGEVNLRKGDWRIAVRGLGFAADGTSTTTAAGQLGDVSFAPGGPVSRSLDFNAFELEGAYTLLQDKIRPIDDDVYALRPRLDLVGGIRVYDVDLRLTTFPSATSSLTSQHDEAFVQGELGVKASVEFYDEFTVDLQLTGGGGPDGYSFDILVGGSWKPINNFGVQIGYRALFFGLDSGSGDSKFELDGAAQGLYAGIVLEF